MKKRVVKMKIRSLDYRPKKLILDFADIIIFLIIVFILLYLTYHFIFCVNKIQEHSEKQTLTSSSSYHQTFKNIIKRYT